MLHVRGFWQGQGAAGHACDLSVISKNQPECLPRPEERSALTA